MARRILSELHQPSELIDRVGRLVGLHLRANAYEGVWTDSAVRRFVLDVGDDLLEDLLALSRADVTTGRVERRAAIARSVAELERRIKELREQEDIARDREPAGRAGPDAAVRARAGPWIQPIKDQLRELVIEGELAAGDKEARSRARGPLYEELGLGDEAQSPVGATLTRPAARRPSGRGQRRRAGAGRATTARRIGRASYDRSGSSRRARGRQSQLSCARDHGARLGNQLTPRPRLTASETARGWLRQLEPAHALFALAPAPSRARVGRASKHRVPIGDASCSRPGARKLPPS